MEVYITPLVTLLICLVNNAFQYKKVEKEAHTTIATIEYKIEELKKQVEKHNGVIERTILLEKEEAIQAEKLRVANHRIDDLEKELHSK